MIEMEVQPEMQNTSPPLVDVGPAAAGVLPPSYAAAAAAVTAPTHKKKKKLIDNTTVATPVVSANTRICFRPIRIFGVESETPIAWSPDGSRFVFVSQNHSIYVAVCQPDGTFHSVENVLEGHVHHVASLKFNPAIPHILASAGHEGIFLWDLTLSHVFKKFLTDGPDCHEAAIECLIWIYDGTVLLSGSRDTNVKVWDAIDGKYTCLETVFAHKAPVMCFAFSPATNMLASAGRDSSIRLWDCTTLAPSYREQRADDASIKIFQAGACDGHRGDVLTMDFSSDGKTLVSGARDNEIKVWNVASFNCVLTMKAHRGDVRSVHLLTNVLLFSCATDGTVKLWQMPEEKNEAITTDDELLLGAAEGNAALMEVLAPTVNAIQEHTEQMVSSFPAHELDVMTMCVNHVQPLMVTASSGNCVRLWSIRDMTKPMLVHEFIGHKETVSSVALIMNEAKLMTGSQDYQMFSFDIATLKREAGINFGAPVKCFCSSPTGSTDKKSKKKGEAQRFIFVGGSNYDIKGYSLNNGPTLFKEVLRFSGHSGNIEALAITPDGKMLASASRDFSLNTWHLKNRYEFQGGFEELSLEPIIINPSSSIEPHRGYVTSLCFNGSGSLLASAGTDHEIILWRVEHSLVGKKWKLKKLWIYNAAHESIASSVCFGSSASENLLFSSSWDSTVKIWDSTKKSNEAVAEPVAVLKGHSSRINMLVCSPNGRYVVSASSDATLRLWSTAPHYDCLVRYVVPTSEGPFTAVSIGKEAIVAGSENGMIRVFPLPVKQYNDFFVNPDQFDEATRHTMSMLK